MYSKHEQVKMYERSQTNSTSVGDDHVLFGFKMLPVKEYKNIMKKIVYWLFGAIAWFLLKAEKIYWEILDMSRKEKRLWAWLSFSVKMCNFKNKYLMETSHHLTIDL